MAKSKVYLSIDLGAGSGRVLAGEFDGSRISLREIHRFANTPIQLPTGWHWNLPHLFQNILEGLSIAAKEYGDALISLGVDTWGVDYGLFDKQGVLLGLPYQYRDSRTDEMIAHAQTILSQEDIYQKTGIQFMFFNSLFQLLAEKTQNTTAINHSDTLLFMPDLISYWLCGEQSQERTIASTSQLYNPKTQDWDRELIDSFGLPQHIFGPLTDPGKTLGKLLPSVIETTGLPQLDVVSVGGHDTASAVAAIPSVAMNPLYLSSGTWSLMGLELDQPVITDQSQIDGFTNEIGVGGKVRFLKNICGLWLIQESRRHWLSEGNDISYGRMGIIAREEEPFRSLINPDDESFQRAGNMPSKIQEFCRRTEQAIPENPGQIVRCIYESLALKYREVWNKLARYAPTQPKALHVVGGGSQDGLLNQFSANALNKPVYAGPVEATGLGSILAQLMANQEIQSLSEGRLIVKESFPCEIFQPENEDRDQWDQAYQRFLNII